MAATTLQVRRGQRVRVIVTAPPTPAVLSRTDSPHPAAFPFTASIVLTANDDSYWSIASGGTLAFADVDEVMVRSDATCALTYSATGKIATEAWTADGVVYTKTYGYDGSDRVASESAWVIS